MFLEAGGNSINVPGGVEGGALLAYQLYGGTFLNLTYFSCQKGPERLLILLCMSLFRFSHLYKFWRESIHLPFLPFLPIHLPFLPIHLPFLPSHLPFLPIHLPIK